MERLENKSIKVSVVVAVYNSVRYLNQTLESICNQTLKDIEIILVDDGSDDGSVDILKKYESIDQRVRVLYQTEVSDGAAMARNLGVASASGEYISVLDADDFFEMDMLEKAYLKAVNSSADVVIFDGDLYDENISTTRETGMILRKEFLLKDVDVFSPYDNADNLFFMTMGSAWNALFSKALIEREDLKFKSFHHADDLGFVYLGFATADKIAILPEKLIHYRYNNSQSQAANLHKWPDAAVGALLSLKEELDKRGLLEKYLVTYTELALHYFNLYLDRMTDYNSFQKLYLDFKVNYAKELCLYILTDDKIRQESLVKTRQRLLNLSPGEYLFEANKKVGMFSNDFFLDGIENGSSLVLYGAGKVGKKVFLALMNDDRYVITGWADKHYDKLGYPIISPSDALKTNHDYLVVAVESIDVYNTICGEVSGLGEPIEKIRHCVLV